MAQYGYTQGHVVPADDSLVIFFLGAGQSNRLGGQPVSTDPILATTALYPTRVLMPNTGVRYYDDIVDQNNDLNRTITSLTALVETDVAGGFKESGMASFGSHLTKLIDDYTPVGPKPKICCYESAHGAFDLSQLMQGSPAYMQGLEAAKQMVKLVKDAGGKALMGGILLNVGESYATAVNCPLNLADFFVEFQRRASPDYQRIFGQEEEIPLYLVQTNTVNPSWPAPRQIVQLAQIEASRRSPYIVVSGSQYQLPMENNDGSTPGHLYSRRIHHSSKGVNYSGQMEARTVFDHGFGLGWRPLSPVRIERASPTTTKVFCHVPRGGSLVIDTSGATVGTTGIATSCGFAFLPVDPKSHNDGSFALAATILGVALVSGENALLITHSAIVGPCWLSYAMFRATSATMDGVSAATDGPVGGARGLIRSSVNHANLYDGSAQYDWMIQWCEAVPGDPGTASNAFVSALLFG